MVFPGKLSPDCGIDRHDHDAHGRLSTIPDEILRHIFELVSPEDNLRSIQLLARRFHVLGNDILVWRQYCRTSFKYWNPIHRFPEKLLAKPASVEWKALWITRKSRDSMAARLLDGIIASQVGRNGKYREICLLGYDAKDFLLTQCHTEESTEDVLARRYYAGSVLDSIHRGVAVEVWCHVRETPSAGGGLDRALGAFDMFVLHDQPYDLEFISGYFDNLAVAFRQEHAAVDDMSTRQKALALVRWLREQNLTGIDDAHRNYRNLKNCLIGHALTDERHPSLPIISSAIFCCVAERLGMTGLPCAFPTHVHAVVFPPAGMDLNGVENSAQADLTCMYLDPYDSDEEVTRQDLCMRLLEFGWTHGTDTFLGPSPVSVIVERTAQNIKAVYNIATTNTAFELVDESAIDLTRLRSRHQIHDLDTALYASMWVEILMKRVMMHWNVSLADFLHRFAYYYSQDAWIVEKYLVPIYDAFVQSHRVRLSGWENAHDILRMLRNLDERQPTVRRRYSEALRNHPKYRIGQVFRHRRYGYIGVIDGWNERGPPASALSRPLFPVVEDSDDDTPAEDAVTTRAYYTCLKSDFDHPRVAQRNVEIVTDPGIIPEHLFYCAGRFFKRFDRETCTFISNIKDEYPDD